MFCLVRYSSLLGLPHLFCASCATSLLIAALVVERSLRKKITTTKDCLAMRHTEAADLTLLFLDVMANPRP